MKRKKSANNSNISISRVNNLFTSHGNDNISSLLHSSSQPVRPHVPCEKLIQRQYGVIPLSSPRVFPSNECNVINFTNDVKWLTQIYNKVREKGVPSYRGARIPVPSELNIPEWRYLLKDYDIKILGEYLKYGFPLEIDYEIFQYNEQCDNHPSAIQRPQGVMKYFKTEVDKKAMIGPLNESPFPKLHISPLMARDKPDGGVRVIVDLSWPQGGSVNSSVPSDIYDTMSYKLKYPTIDDIVQKVVEIGPTALLYKVDLERAFRNLRIDPYDYSALGLQWQGKLYVDVALAFGFPAGATICQLCTELITHVLRMRNTWVVSYLDDNIGVALPNQANSQFQSLVNILNAVNLI